MNIQLQGFQNGFAVVDGGKVSQELNGYRFTVTRLEDNALYHFATVRQVKELWK